MTCLPAGATNDRASSSTDGGGAAPGTAETVPCPGASGSAASATGGSQAGSGTGLLRMVVPGDQAKIVDGLAAAPADAPPAVQDMIWAANAHHRPAVPVGRRPCLLHLPGRL